MLDGDEKALQENEEFAPHDRMMSELSAAIRERRGKRGSIDFDFPETRIELDEDGHPTDIRPYERNAATKIIEDFMLLANETVAEEYYWRELPFLYRTHDVPDEEKMRQLAAFINNFGYHIHVRNEVKPKEIQKLLAKVEGSPEEAMISRLALQLHEAGEVYYGEYRTFRPGCKILYALYLPDPEISGSADPQDHQGEFERKADGGEDPAL